ncbi:AciT family ciprofloxacin tolerance protein [Alkanindiges sp. WGS2144]|uniref:AciT family ciprofloxacin tolerance protein n=1 Tax=Alkanindiges sp. WGS2144 TaxID=3366808 RepID=UPI0037530491
MHHNRRVIMLNGEVSMTIGIGLVALGAIIIFFSPYRRWLGFMLAGMLFWCFLEVSRVASQYLFAFSDFQGYMTGIGAALAVLATWLAATEETPSTAQQRQCIEHTPVYDDDLTPMSGH